MNDAIFAIVVLLFVVALFGLAIAIGAAIDWLVVRVLGRLAGAVSAFAELAAVGWLWQGSAAECNQPVQYFDPPPGSTHPGSLVAACDSPGGAVVEFMIVIGFPAIMLGLLLAAFLVLRSGLRQSQAPRL